jgi:predicted transcriptional regulator
MSVLFYRGIALLLVASTLTALLIWIIGLKLANKLIIGRDVVLAFTLMFSTNIMFFTHFPVTADRSVTIFLLGYMNNHADVKPVMTKEELQNVFIDKYVKEYDAMDRRMNEQIVTGTIEKTTDGNYRLTPKGKLFVKFNVWIGNYYGLDEKNINPQ